MTSPPESQEDSLFEAPAVLSEEVIIFPETEVTVTMHDPMNIAAAKQGISEKSLVVLVPAHDSRSLVGSIGTLVLLRSLAPTRGGSESTLKALWRIRVKEVVEDRSYVRVRFSRAGRMDDLPSDRTDTMKSVFGQIDEFAGLIPGIPPEIISMLKGVDSPGRLADLCAQSPYFTHDERLELLRTLDPEERLTKVSTLFKRQLDDLKRMTTRKTIAECTTCMDLADKAFEAGMGKNGELLEEFLGHIVSEHPEEVLALLAERYGPTFLRRRAMK